MSRKPIQYDHSYTTWPSTLGIVLLLCVLAGVIATPIVIWVSLW